MRPVLLSFDACKGMGVMSTRHWLFSIIAIVIGTSCLTLWGAGWRALHDRADSPLPPAAYPVLLVMLVACALVIGWWRHRHAGSRAWGLFVVTLVMAGAFGVGGLLVGLLIELLFAGAGASWGVMLWAIFWCGLCAAALPLCLFPAGFRANASP